MNPTEPTWRSYIVETTTPIFSPKQCQMVIDKGMSLKKETAAVGMGNPDGSGVDTKKRITTISWIPFKEMPEMYKDINRFVSPLKRAKDSFLVITTNMTINEQIDFILEKVNKTRKKNDKNRRK